MKRKDIILYSKDSFLYDLIKQSHPSYHIEQRTAFTIPKIKNNLPLIVIDDIACNEKLINSLSDLCTIIAIGNKNIYSKQITFLKKPIVYNEIIEIIDSSRKNLMSISDNIWVNMTSRLFIYLNDQNITSNSLTEKEYDLLLYLISKDFAPKSKIEILNNVFGYNETVFTSTLETHLSRLRQKISPIMLILYSEKEGYKIKKSEENIES